MSLDSFQTPSLAKVIQDAILMKLGDLHTCIPGIVDGVDHVKKTVDVRLSLKRKYRIDESPIELPKLSSVPLGFLQTKESIISLPVAKGDDVWVYFSERSIDAWKDTSDSDGIESRIVSPDDPRMHHISDAVAVPMFKPISTGMQSDPTNILIQNKDGKIKISPSGKFSIGNNSEELLSIISEIIQAILDAKTNTQIGPQPFVNLATFSAIKSRLDSSLKV